MTQRAIIMDERMVLSYLSGRLSPGQTRPQQALARFWSFPALLAGKAVNGKLRLAGRLFSAR